MPRPLALALLPLLLVAPALAAPPDQIQIEGNWGKRRAEDVQAVLESLVQAKAAGVLSDGELASLKDELLGRRPAVVSGQLRDAPLGEALLAVAATAAGFRPRLGLACRQRDLERLNTIRVSAFLSETDPAEALRLLLGLADQEGADWEVEYEESDEGVFVVRVHTRDEDEEEDDGDRDDRSGAGGERGGKPGRGAPAPAPKDGGLMGLSLMPSGGPVGLRVVQVAPGSPAERAGIKVGDMLMSADGRPLARSEELVQACAAAKPEQGVRLLVLREGLENQLELLLLGGGKR